MKIWLKRGLLAILAILVTLVVVLAVNTIRYQPDETTTQQVEAVDAPANVDEAAAKLSQAVQFETDSSKETLEPFKQFIEWLPSAFPAVHGKLQREMIGGYTPLYTWEGSGTSLPPIMLSAHYDVVPISQATLGDWLHPPYSGTIEDGYVWGRGTLDDKGAVVAIMQAAENLIQSGFQPKRTIYFSFGHDEEVSGQKGAAVVAAELKRRGVQLDWILDEGSFVLDKIIPGLERPVASINLSEKGFLTIVLAARSAGGHSSMPPKETAVGILASALDRLQKAPIPGGLTGISESFFDTLGRHFALPQRIVFANRWLFSGLLENTLSDSASTNAMLRTTTAPTMLTGSPKENILPTEATATVNFRLHPRDTVEGVIDHVRKAIDDERIEIRPKMDTAALASPVSDETAQGYSDIRDSITAAFGPVATVPGLTIAATDARHYAKAADNAYRINPFKITGDDLSRFHGLNERLSLENLKTGIGFYSALLKRQ